MRVAVFEDCGWRELHPLTDFKPVWELSFSLGKLSDRFLAAADDLSWWPRRDLRELCPGPLFDPEEPGGGPLFLVNGALREPGSLLQSHKLAADELRGELCVVGDKRRLVWARLEPDEAGGLRGVSPDEPRFIESIISLPGAERFAITEEETSLFRRPWELVEANAEAIRRDFSAYVERNRQGRQRCEFQGEAERVFIEEGARVEAGVFFSTAEGPVVVAAGAELRAPSRIEGPCYIGPKTVVDSASLRPGCTFGEDCRVSGEIEASIFAPHVNKHHYGFIGHSYVGEWVNLGAGTTNSDLKNTYGEVRAHTREGRVPTGLAKVGCFLGDHVKLGIGTLLGTGVSVGPFSNIFASPTVAGYAPPFSWGPYGAFETFEPAKALEVAKVVMARRGVELGPDYRRLIEGCALSRE
ncbi:MAG TPA: hypothetical protein ENN88_01350 [Candidatus Coatesbacteria bacterium]|nr:hypothetical protein [Candidatus Coatesbacteria bacterium]